MENLNAGLLDGLLHYIQSQRQLFTDFGGKHVKRVILLIKEPKIVAGKE